MAQSDNPGRPSCHILDFFYDEEDSSALTALINGVRFHIIVDAEQLRNLGHEPLLTEYFFLLQDARNGDDNGQSADGNNNFAPDSRVQDPASGGKENRTKAQIRTSKMCSTTQIAR